MWSLAPVATKLEDCACVARPPWDSVLRVRQDAHQLPGLCGPVRAEEDLQVPRPCCD